MGIMLQNPPEGSQEVLESVLDSFRLQSNFAAEVTRDSAAVGNLNIAAPHPVYFVGLRDLAKGRLLAAAKLKGWRYLLVDESQPYAAIQLNTNKKKLVFSHINQGVLVERTVQALGFAESLQQVVNDNYELRLLDIPGLYVVALWLHGEKDLIIPLLMGSEPINKFKAYTEDEIINLLQGESYVRLQFDETKGG